MLLREAPLTNQGLIRAYLALLTGPHDAREAIHALQGGDSRSRKPISGTRTVSSLRLWAFSWRRSRKVTPKPVVNWVGVRLEPYYLVPN